jgi:REP element-mobilizing transposase RayT
MMIYDPDSHHRRSIRLQAFDYSRDGAYFLTICTVGRDCLFGEIVDSVMRLNAAGQAVADSWNWMALQYPYVRIDEWALMPNHFHGIIVIATNDGRGGSRTAPTAKTKPLGQLVGAFKTVSTKRVNLLRHTPGTPVWQRNYYERVLRNDGELSRTREYIINNPSQWDLDQDNPANLP